MKIIRALFVVLFSVATGACSVYVAPEQDADLPSVDKLIEMKQIHKWDVKLVANGKGNNQAELLILTGPMNCKKFNKVGCVRVPKDEGADITFRLYGAAAWKFRTIQLIYTDEKSGFATQNDFKEKMRNDFYVTMADGDDDHPDIYGKINLQGLDDPREFTLHDANNLEQVYRYQITACKGNICIKTDPRFENEGTST